MSINEQVKELREYVSAYETQPFGREVEGTVRVLSEAADTIEALSAKLENMERSEDCGGWILCKDRLPEEKVNPITKDFYEYEVTFKSEDVTDIRHYKFGRGHWWNGPGCMDDYVVAWRKRPEPYRAAQELEDFDNPELLQEG